MGKALEAEKEGQSMPGFGNCEDSAQVGGRPVCSGEEEEEGERRQGWKRSWGSIMRVLQ